MLILHVALVVLCEMIKDLKIIDASALDIIFLTTFLYTKMSTSIPVMSIISDVNAFFAYII